MAWNANYLLFAETHWEIHLQVVEDRLAGVLGIGDSLGKTKILLETPCGQHLQSSGVILENVQIKVETLWPHFSLRPQM
jgi:hypothetical protein